MADSIFKIPKLSNSDNWDIWSLRIEAILIEKGYLDVCQTSEESYIESIANLDPREGEARLEARRALSLKALAYIRLALADGPLLQTKSIRDPYKLLKALGGLYESKGFSSEFILCKSLINTTLSNSKGNLELYLQNVRRLVNDLESKNISLPTNFIAALVLNNLSKEYDYIVTIITQTIRENSIVNLDAIFSQLIDESRRLKYNNRGHNKEPSNIDTSISRDIEMSSSATSTKTSNNSKNLVCSYCSKKGHKVERCFAKHPELRPNNKMNVSSTTMLEEDKREETIMSTSITTSDFVLDSAATIHICYNKELFDYINPVNTTIKWGNNTSNTIKASGIGDISLKFLSTNQNARLTGVLYIPELRVNLISLALLAKRDINLNFTKDVITIYKPNSKAILARGLYKDNVVSFKVASNKRDNSSIDRNIVLSTQSTYNSWHQRLGHIGSTALKALPNNVQGLDIDFSKYTNIIEEVENKDLEPIDLDLHSTIEDKDLSIDIPIEDCITEVNDSMDIEDMEPIKAREHTTQEEFYNQLLDYSVLATSSIDSEPTTLKEVLEHPDKDKYLDAIEVEIKGLKDNNTWTLVPRPKDKPVLKGRLVFKKKLKANGDLDKYKARYVAKGYLQKQGINYNETFASTTKPVSLRLLLAIATILDLEVYKGDVKQAFAIPSIDAEVYLEQPPLYNEDKSLVCRLNKALYGLKQAARQWQKHINHILLGLGFRCLISDNSIYIHNAKEIILAIYVDDILVFAKDTTIVDQLFEDLRDKELDISNLGPTKEFLGIEINRNRDIRSLSISQEGYITRLLERYNKTKLKPLKKPYIEGRILERFNEQASKEDILQYQKEIGALIYLTIYTRVDLAFRVGQLARFMSNPSSDHFKALDDVWAYLNITKSYAIGFSMFKKQSATEDLNIIGYTDADWGGDIATRKSTSGYVNLLSSKLNKDYKGSITFPISWNSKLQKTVALSSCEAEYMAYKESFKETIYINSLLSELPRNVQDLFSKTNTVYTDSQSAIQLAKDPMFHSRTKHVSIRYYFIKEKVTSKEIELVYCPTDKLLADGLTKTISTPKWLSYINGLGLVPYKA